MLLILSFVSFSMVKPLGKHLVQCSQETCAYVGTVNQVCTHYIWKHCTLETVPYSCKDCGYRSWTRIGMRIHQSRKHKIEVAEQDLPHYCHGSHRTPPLPRMYIKRINTAVQRKRLNYDNIPKQELISRDHAIISRVRRTSTRNYISYCGKARYGNFGRRQHDAVLTDNLRSDSEQAQACTASGRSRPRQRQAQACSNREVPRKRQAQASHAWERTTTREPTQARPAWEQLSTRKRSSITAEPQQKRVRFETPPHTSQSTPRLEDLALDKIVEQASPRIDLLPYEIFVLPKPGTRTDTDKGTANTDCVSLSGTQTEDKQRTPSTNAPRNKTARNQASCTVTRPTTKGDPYDEDELAEPEALSHSVTRLLALDEDDITTDKADEPIAETIMEVNHPGTSSQSEITDAINTAGPDSDINNVTSTMEKLALANPEKQNPPISSEQAQGARIATIQQESADNSDSDTSEASVEVIENMPLIPGLKGKLKKSSTSDNELAASIQQLSRGIQSFQEENAREMSRLTEQMRALCSTIERMFPMIERHITWSQQVAELLQTQLHKQPVSTQAQTAAADEAGTLTGEKQ